MITSEARKCQFSASQRGFPCPCALTAGSHVISGHRLAPGTVFFVGFMKNHLTGNVSSGCLRAEFGSPGTGRVWWGKDLEVVSVLSLDLVGVRNRNGLKSSCLGNAREKQNIQLMIRLPVPTGGRTEVAGELSWIVSPAST